MLTLGSGSKLTFIEVLTVNNYKITFLSNIHGERERNVTGCVVFIIHIMVVFHSLNIYRVKFTKKEVPFC